MRRTRAAAAAAMARRRNAVIGSVLVVVAVVVAFVMFLQPWMSCEEEDSAAGCPVPAEAVGWTNAVWVVTIGMIVIGVILTVRPARRPRRASASGSREASVAPLRGLVTAQAGRARRVGVRHR